MQKPVTIKLYLKGEVVDGVKSVTTETGEVITLEEIRKIVVPSKKNQKRPMVNKTTGRAYLIPSQQYLDWLKEHIKVFDDYYLKLYERRDISLPIVRCDIKVLFYYPDARTRDNGNKYETIRDMLRDSGIIADDSFKVFNNENTKGKVCRDKPRTEIYITILPPSHPDYDWDITSEEYYEKKKQRRTIQRRMQRAKQKLNQTNNGIQSKVHRKKGKAKTH